MSNNNEGSRYDKKKNHGMIVVGPQVQMAKLKQNNFG